MSIFTQDTIRIKLNELGRASATVMAKATGMSVSTCSRYLKAMAKANLITVKTTSYRQGIDAHVYYPRKEQKNG